MNKRWQTWIAAVVLVGVSAACNGSEHEHPDAREAFEALSRQPAGEVVATVNGRAISAGEFEAFWRENSALEREAALEAIIEREVLVQHAREKLEAGNDELGFARKQGMVRVLLRELVEKQVSLDGEADVVSEQDLARLRALHGQPAGIRASHLLIYVPGEPGGDGRDNSGTPMGAEERAKLFESAQGWAVQVAEELGERATLEELYEAQVRYADKVPAPLQVMVNAHLSFPAAGVAAQEGARLPQGWLPVVAEFAAAATAMQGSPPGTLSAPAKSDFGWHIIRYERAIAAVEPDMQALVEIEREERLRDARAQRVNAISSELIEAATINIFPQVIGQQAQIHNR
ncbi:MAG: hypothetical protein H0U74_16325 [Bradymonadaceae bacterium]|nr:hypothetical protein [Lujinxingiaceae bacterium]